jgi:hypothetical protein
MDFLANLLLYFGGDDAVVQNLQTKDYPKTSLPSS